MSSQEEVIDPKLIFNVPPIPSGSFEYIYPTETTTSTTPIPPTLIPKIFTPENSGIRDFSIVNPYIHYINKGQPPNISITPSAYLVIAPILFNQYNLVQRTKALNNEFISATIYLNSPT
jgi:hypothetical protein